MPATSWATQAIAPPIAPATLPATGTIVPATAPEVVSPAQTAATIPPKTARAAKEAGKNWWKESYRSYLK